MKVIKNTLINIFFIILSLFLFYFSKEEMETKKQFEFIDRYLSFQETINKATDEELENVQKIIQYFVSSHFPEKKFSSFFAEHNKPLSFFVNDLNLNSDVLYKEVLRVHFVEKYGYFRVGTNYLIENGNSYLIFSTKLNRKQILGFVLLANDVNGKTKFNIISGSIFILTFSVLNIILFKFRRRK